MSKGTDCDHNILIQRNFNCHDTQWNQFQTQAAEEITCPILNPENVEMKLIQI